MHTIAVIWRELTLGAATVPILHNSYCAVGAITDRLPPQPILRILDIISSTTHYVHMNLGNHVASMYFAPLSLAQFFSPAILQSIGLLLVLLAILFIVHTFCLFTVFKLLSNFKLSKKIITAIGKTIVISFIAGKIAQLFFLNITNGKRHQKRKGGSSVQLWNFTMDYFFRLNF